MTKSLRKKSVPVIPGIGEIDRRSLLQMMGGAAVASLGVACSPGNDEERVSFASWSGEPLHFASLLEVADLIKSRQISPVELTGMLLDRISLVDARLKSYATVLRDQALQSARAAEAEILAGNYRGPLHGIPLAVKDLCYTKGTRTMGGLAALRDFVPDYDATVIQRLEQAGAVLLGKLNLTEGAMAGYHRDFDIPVNPWGDDLWVGASSSGSGVATAAGLCFASLGSDTGGSIRFPSMANGVVGLKPTYGRVSRYGVIALAESMDHIGPMTRQVGDAAAILQVIAGFDSNDPTSLQAPVPDMLSGLSEGVSGLRLGYDPNSSAQGVDAQLVGAIEKAVQKMAELGAEIVEVQVPPFGQELGDAWFAICAYEVHQAHQETFPARANEYGDYLRGMLEQGALITREAYAAANQVRAEFSGQYEAALEEIDALISPGGGVPFGFPPELQYEGSEELDPAVVSQVYVQFTFPADFSGVPTLSLPCGISPSGVPWTFQFTGNRLSEALLCRIGQAYEDATEWHDQHPRV